MSLKNIKAGFADSIQDIGRYGYQHLGINASGAMDKYAAQIANVLAGNPLHTAVIEIHFPASVFLFTKPAIIAISGANFSPAINGEAAPILHPIIVNKNDVLQFQQPVTGARCYLAVGGGILCDEWLNSCSTHLKIKAGGYQGRYLQKEDELFFKSNTDSTAIEKGYKVLPWKADVPSDYKDDKIFILPGNEWNRLTEVSKKIAEDKEFTITPQSDRMGYKLSGAALTQTTYEELVSSAVSFGTIQLLPDGNLIILMADHQTTGGYPRIAHVISAHHSKLAQAAIGSTLRFQLTDQATAETLFLQQQQQLVQLQNACLLKLKEFNYGS
jgi:antagonist of KipI